MPPKKANSQAAEDLSVDTVVDAIVSSGNHDEKEGIYVCSVAKIKEFIMGNLW